MNKEEKVWCNLSAKLGQDAQSGIFCRMRELKSITECEKDITDVTMRDMYNLTIEFSKEGKMGIIRFPKRLRDLYQSCVGDFISDKKTITSILINIMNDNHLNYSEAKLWKN